MGLSVETSYLRGYAAQLDGNRTGVLAELRAYCAAYCGDTAGLDGTLTPARCAVDSMSDGFLRAMDGAERGLRNTADALRLTADRYDSSDAAAAGRLWTTGRTGELPRGYAERDVVVMTRGFSAGATVNLAVPPERHDAKRAKESLASLLGDINSIVQWITGKDVLGAAMPIVFGEWGVLRRIAQACDELERGYDRVAQDLADGVDLVSAHWTGDGPGASTVFDYHMREQWIRGFKALANVANGAQQSCEWIANAYEYLVHVFLMALDRYTKGMRASIRALTAPNPAQGMWHLLQLATDVLDLADDTIRMICMQTEVFASSIEMLAANLHGMADIFSGGVDVFDRA